MPTAWSERFIVRELDDEVLVYDLTNQRVASLNRTAARVWKASGGQADADLISSRLAVEADGEIDLAAIKQALKLLGDASLIDPPAKRRKPASTRRSFLTRLTSGSVAAAAAAPIVVSVLAPTPAQAASGSCGGMECEAPTPFCNWEEECVQCLNYEDCVEIGKSFCSNFECY